MFTSRSSAKWRNIQWYPYASLCVDRREPPYAPVILYEPITEVDMLVYELVYHGSARYFRREERRGMYRCIQEQFIGDCGFSS
jgi:hypothetical protein